MRLTRIFPLGLPLVLGCQQELTVPTIGDDPIALELSVSTLSLRPGAADTIRVRVVNKLAQGIRLTFSSLCQVFVTVRNQAGDVVTPRDGRPQCLPVQSQLALAANGSQVFTVIWRGGFDFVPPDTPARVPPGSYFISAELLARGYSTLAPAFKVEVLP
jgi:hypothetical protein